MVNFSHAYSHIVAETTIVSFHTLPVGFPLPTILQRVIDLRSCDGTMWTPVFSLETEGLCDFTQCRDMTTVNLCAHDYPCNSTHSRAPLLWRGYL